MSLSVNVTTIPKLLPIPQTVLAAKVPKWDLSDLVYRACPVCLCDNKVDVCVRPDNLIVSECAQCHMIYLPMIPSKTQLLKFYSKYASYKGFVPTSPFRSIFSMRSRNPYLDILLSTGGVQGQRICEVGCSYGRFLEECRREGASILGVEWDQQATEHLLTRKIAVERELPDQAEFDVICAFQLIEHLEEPKNFISKAASLLVSDGRLLLSLPNGGEIRTIGPAWVGFRVDLEHLNYFSLFSLSTLLQDYGLYIEHYWEYSQPGVSRQQQTSACSKILSKIRKKSNINYGAPNYSDGKFVLSVLARKP